MAAAMIEGWAVVKFLDDDNSVAVVPESWIKHKNNIIVSHWPPAIKNPTLYVKRRMKPAEEWPQYAINILGKYNNYDTAVKKSLKAEKTSDLSSAAEHPIKRIRKKNEKYRFSRSSSSSEVQDERDNGESEDNAAPALPQALQKEVNDNGISIKKDYLITKKSLKESQSPSLPRELNTPAQASITIDGNAMISMERDFQKLVLTKLNILLAHRTRFDERMDELEALIIQSKSAVNSNAAEEDDQLLITFNSLLPLKNKIMLEDFNLFLNAHRKFVAKELSRIGGSTAKELTKKIMYNVFTNEFGQLYSWDGGKGKLKFRELEISKVIIDAVRLNGRTREAPTDEIINAIKLWLVKAKERFLKGQKNKEKEVETYD